MKNRRNIVEQQNPPQNPNDIWLKDGKFYRSTSEGWTVIDSELEYTNKEAMTADNPKGGTIGIDKESGEPSIYNNVTKQWSPLGGGVTETTWQELKDKRDAGKLTPGSLYRITNYQCTTTQENTQSAGHQFDIVLLALSANKLAEEGWAMMHDNIYDVTFLDGVTKKCYLYKLDNGYNEYCIVDVQTLLGVEGALEGSELIISEESKTVSMTDDGYDSNALKSENLTYNYFQNSNLSAWKVWYCLDNDTSRFAWAQNEELLYGVESDFSNGKPLKRCPSFDNELYGEFKYAWGTDADVADNDGSDFVYSKSEHINKGDTIMFQENYDIISPSSSDVGHGVIYRLIDEFNNDIKYDFKNIQFKRKLTNGQYDVNGTDTWCYTLNLWYEDMCQDASIVGNTLPNDEGFVNGVYDNKFGYATAYDSYIEGVDTFAFALGNNVVLSFDDNGDYYGIYSNTIGNSFFSNTFGNDFHNNMIGNNVFLNIIGNKFYGNIIGNSFTNKTISNDTSGKNYGNNGVELATKNDLN